MALPKGFVEDKPVAAPPPGFTEDTPSTATVSSAPDTSGIAKIVQMARHENSPDEETLTAISQAHPELADKLRESKALGKSATEILNGFGGGEPTPWYDKQLIHPDTWFGLREAAQKADPRTVGGAFLHAAHGALQSAGEMATPKNVAVGGGLALANLIPGVGEVADAAVLGTGAKGIFDTGKDVYDKAKSGDVAGAEETLGQGIPNAVGTAYTGYHGATGIKPETGLPAKVAGAPLEYVGKAIRLPAAPLAESALGVTAKNRMYERSPGKAILADTSGFSPGAVEDSARATLNDLTSQRNAIANNYKGTVSLAPALRQIMDERAQAAKGNNAPLAKDIDSMFEHLGYDTTTNPGQSTPIPMDVPPAQALDLLSGFRDRFTKYDAANPGRDIKIGQRVAHTLSKEITDTVPGIKALHERISSLIPVEERADITDRGAGIIQHAAKKLTAPTGALLGGAAGFHEFGPIGALGGLLGPLLVGSPEAQLAAARILNATGNGLVKAAPHLGAAAIKVPVVQKAVGQ